MTFAWDLLERYRILRILATGAHAHVYVARNVATRRLCALKVLDRERVRQLEAAGRLRDARAIADSHAPGIVAVESVSCTSDECAYVAADLHEGQSLAARLARGPLPCADAILFCLHVGLALCEARDRGVLHGGIKPSNVFVVADPGLPRGERALLGDFGTASAAGTPMPSADVRGLGSLLHQLVTGEPYRGESVAQMIDRGLAAVLAILIARRGSEVSIEATVDTLSHLAAFGEIDADPTDSKLPLRSPPRDAAVLRTAPGAASSDRTAMFALVDPDAI